MLRAICWWKRLHSRVSTRIEDRRKIREHSRETPAACTHWIVAASTTRRKIVMQRGGFPMNALKRPGIYAGFTSLVLMSALAAPAALAQTKTFPPGTDCSKLSGTDMATCQSQQSSQQMDGTVGNGAPAGTPPANNGIGAGNQVVPNNTANPTGGGANSTGSVNGVQNAPSGQNGQNGPSGTPNANTNNTSNP
jgi:hypothetical protein